MANTFQKPAFLLLLALFFSVFGKAQIVDIPDPIFKNLLLSGLCSDTSEIGVNFINVDANQDGQIQMIEAQAIKRLILGNQSISNLKGIEAFANLTALYCAGNQLTELDLIDLVKLKTLVCNNNFLGTLNIQNSKELQELNCNFNNLNEINFPSLSNIKYLFCSNNQLTDLNLTAATNLISLSCSNNQLTNLDLQNCGGLKSVYCYQNNLNSLNINGLSEITEIDCTYNQISDLATSNCIHLITLQCANNLLSDLDLQNCSKLSLLNCALNQLTVLNLQDLKHLYYIVCQSNLLTSLNLTGLDSLKTINCAYNNLSILNLEKLPQLLTVNCSVNQITQLDVHSAMLMQTLSCDFNLIETLIIKNNSQQVLNLANNPIKEICCDDFELAYVQLTVAQANISNCNIITTCNNNPSPSQSNIFVESIFDANGDGCDANDPTFGNLTLNLVSDSISTIFTDSSQFFSVPIFPGANTITPEVENPAYFTISPNFIQVTYPVDSSTLFQQFCITPNGVHHDVTIQVLPISAARPGYDVTFQLVFKNIGTQIESGTLQLTFDDDHSDFVSSNVAAVLQGNMLNWDYSINPTEQQAINIVFNLNSPIETPPLNIGDNFKLEAILQNNAQDETPLNNIFTLNQPIVGSFDPNDKTCLEGKEINENQVGQFLHYIIRFENTGNFEAQNVSIQDFLDPQVFDISSLRFINSSHACSVQLDDANNLAFLFENINLPYSGPDKYGFVAFKINTKSNLVKGNMVKNQAKIVFDFNAPIITNQAIVKIVANTSSAYNLANDQPSMQIFPNPTNRIIFLNTTIPVERAVIYNALGELVLLTNVEHNQISVENFPTGTYFIKVFGDLNNLVGWFIKN